MIKPDYIFESSWEVCNKVGGIYTVLSTRAKTLQDNLSSLALIAGAKRNVRSSFRITAFWLTGRKRHHSR